MIRVSAIGDVVRTLPALTCLRRAWPQAHIAWAVEEASREILTDQPDLDEILVFPRRKLSRVWLHPDEISATRNALRAFGRSLRDSRFDLVIDFQATFKTGLMAWLTKAPRRVGLPRGQARERADLFYTETANLPAGAGRQRMSRVDRALALVAHLGVDVQGATSQIPERAEDAAYVETFLAGMGLPKPRARATNPAVVFPGTSRTQAHKRYPTELFAQAADLVARQTGSPIVVAWGPGEEEMAEEVISSMKTPGTLAPPMTLGQLTALIRRSRVFLAGDTGPMHIAWTVGTPVVAIYGPTDPDVNRPGGECSAVAYEKIFCSPCRNRGCIARSCLHQLAPEKVAAAAAGVIQKAEVSRTAPRFEMINAPTRPRG